MEQEDGSVGGVPQQMNDSVPYATQERQELVEVKDMQIHLNVQKYRGRSGHH